MQRLKARLGRLIGVGRLLQLQRLGPGHDVRFRLDPVIGCLGLLQGRFRIGQFGPGSDQFPFTGAFPQLLQRGLCSGQDSLGCGNLLCPGSRLDTGQLCLGSLDRRLGSLDLLRPRTGLQFVQSALGAAHLCLCLGDGGCLSRGVQPQDDLSTLHGLPFSHQGLSHDAARRQAELGALGRHHHRIGHDLLARFYSGQLGGLRRSLRRSGAGPAPQDQIGYGRHNQQRQGKQDPLFHLRPPIDNSRFPNHASRTGILALLIGQDIAHGDP